MGVKRENTIKQWKQDVIRSREFLNFQSIVHWFTVIGLAQSRDLRVNTESYSEYRTVPFSSLLFFYFDCLLFSAFCELAPHLGERQR